MSRRLIAESDALQFVKDIEDMKKLGWDGKDSTYKEYMQKVEDMRNVNKEMNIKEAKEEKLLKSNKEDFTLDMEDLYRFLANTDNVTTHEAIEIYEILFDKMEELWNKYDPER